MVTQPALSASRARPSESAKADELEVYKRIAHIDDLPTVDTSSDDARRSKPHPDIFQAALANARPLHL